MQNESSSPDLFYALLITIFFIVIGVVIIGFWFNWFWVTKQIRDDLRQLIDLLKKDRPE